MTIQHYMNLETGEIVFTHDEAMEWLRGGTDVEVVADNGRTIIWEAYKKCSKKRK